MLSSESLAETLRELRTLARREWIKCLGYTNALEALAWFDELGITNGGRQGRARRLVVALEEAVSVIQSSHYQQVKDRAPRAHTLGRRYCAFFVVVYDPEDLFRCGARFDALSVWGNGGNPPKRGELTTGLVLDYHKGKLSQRFVFNGACFVEIAGNSCDFVQVCDRLHYCIECKEYMVSLYL